MNSIEEKQIDKSRIEIRSKSSDYSKILRIKKPVLEKKFSECKKVNYSEISPTKKINNLEIPANKNLVLESISTEMTSNTTKNISNKMFFNRNEILDHKNKKTKNSDLFIKFCLGISRIIHFQRKIKEKRLIEGINKLICCEWYNQSFEKSYIFEEKSKIILNFAKIHNVLIIRKKYQDPYYLELKEMYNFKTAKNAYHNLNDNYFLLNSRKKLRYLKT